MATMQTTNTANAAAAYFRFKVENNLLANLNRGESIESEATFGKRISTRRPRVSGRTG
jgi:hypothetical protein